MKQYANYINYGMRLVFRKQGISIIFPQQKI